MTSGISPVAFVANVRRRMRGSIVVCAVCALIWPQIAPAQESGALTLRDALAFTLQRNPELAAYGKERAATEAAILQAGVLPNPVLGLAVENVGNSRLTQAGDRATAIQIGQLIELGGKRLARIRAAEAGRDVAGWDYEAKRIEILFLVGQRFVDLLVAQKRQELAKESLALASQVSDAASRRVQAGKVSPVEETKARLAQASAEVELEQARREGVAARHALSALWSEPSPRFDRAAGELAHAGELRPYEQLAARVRDNPELARWSSEIERRRALVATEKAKAVPDVTVSAGVMRFSQFEDSAFMIGVSVPLPLFDRNQGGILEATRRLDKAADEARAVESRMLADLARVYQRLVAIGAEMEILARTLLPGAQSAFDAATRGYQLGKFGFLDVLDAQRTLAQVRIQNLRALADYRRGMSEIERLIGGPLEHSPGAPNKK